MLSLLLRGKMRDAFNPGVAQFVAHDGENALHRCIEQEAHGREVEMGGLWLQERGGARTYVEELLREIAVERPA